MPDPEAPNLPRWALRGPFRSVALAAALAVGAGGLAACEPASRGNERWTATENTNVDINWDAVKEAYLAAEGPEDLERRVNEIYEGDEIISVSVRDQDEKTQIVTGFFDKNTDGQVGEDEKIFSIQRDIASPEAAQVQMQGHGHYAHYHSPIWDIATGMMLGSMMSRAFMPSYSPLYVQPYTTSPARVSAISTQRSSYRAANPQRFAKRSTSGRSYGSKGGGFGGRSSTPTRRSGGGRFGLGDRGKRQRVRLSA